MHSDEGLGQAMENAYNRDAAKSALTKIEALELRVKQLEEAVFRINQSAVDRHNMSLTQ